MNNFIQLLKPLKTPAKYLLYFFIAFVLFYLFGQPPEFRDEVTKKIRLYTENYIDSQQEKNEAISIDSIPDDVWTAEQLANAKESLREELDEYFYRPANLKKADPQKALNLYNQAKKLNPELNLKFKDIAVIEKCVEVSPFDGVEFLKKYGLEEEHDKGIDPYYVWKLAEDAASSQRFGPPDAKLVLQLICHGSWVPAEIEFAVEDAYDNWKNQKQPDFNLCNSVTSSHGMMRCVNRASKRMEETKTLTYPKVVDHIWEVDGITILPTCTEIIWSSGDNVEEYEEKFPSADNFRSYPGQYWGRLIPLQPIDASWGEAVSWPQLIDKCNKIESGVPEKTKNFIRINDPKADHREDESNYTLLAEWGSDDCSKLVPYFSEHCKSLVFLSMNEGTIFGRAWNTYAYISQEEGDYIVPVTTGKPLDEVIKMIEQNPKESIKRIQGRSEYDQSKKDSPLIKLPTESPELKAEKEEVRKNPNDAYAHASLGLIYQKLGQHKNAIRSFKKAIRIKPDHTVTHYDLGRSYQKLGQHKNAIASYKEVLRLNPDHYSAKNNIKDIKATKKRLFLKTEFTKDKRYYYLR